MSLCVKSLCLSLSVSLIFLDMVQLEQYDASPSVSVEPDANVEVNLYFCYH